MDEDVTNKIKTGWMKWNAIGVLGDCIISDKVKSKFYGTIVRPTMFYESERWATR